MTVAIITLAAVATGAIVVLIFWAVRLFRANIEANRAMAASDREQYKLVLDIFDRLRAELEIVSASALRIEAAAKVVAGNLVVAQSVVDDVATNLADRGLAADAQAKDPTSVPGQVADAGAQTPRPNGDVVASEAER